MNPRNGRMTTTSKTKHRTTTKTKQNLNKTIQKQQTYNIIQNIFECSVAGICKDRNLFPNHYFMDYETSRTSSKNHQDNKNNHLLVVSKFNLDLLLSKNDKNSCENVDEESVTRRSISIAKGEGQQLSSTRDIQNVSTATSGNCSSTTINSEHNSKDHGYGEVLPSMSPLTSSMLPVSTTTPSFSYIKDDNED